MKVKAPAERNFRRAKSKPGRAKGRFRPSWRTLKMAITLGLVAFGMYRAFDLVLSARVLQVSRIAVQGNTRLSKGEVEQLAHGLYGRNILTAELGAARRSLLDSPWVADAALRRVLPSTIEIVISERRPFGVSRLSGQLYLIDREGVVIDEYGPQYADFDLPIIDGLVQGRRNARSAIDPARARFAARVIDSLVEDAALTQRVSQIDVSNLHNAVVLLDDDSALLHVGEERFRERLQSYVEVASALRESVPDIDYVDLRFEDRVYVKPRSGAHGTTIRPSAARRAY